MKIGDHQKLKLLIFSVSKNFYLVMYGFWYDYMKQKYGEKEKLCYMDTRSFIAYIKTEDMYSDIAKDVKARFDTSNYELDRPLPKGINKKVVGLMENELRRKVMTEVKIYSYSDSDKNDSDKKRYKNVCHNKLL